MRRILAALLPAALLLSLCACGPRAPEPAPTPEPSPPTPEEEITALLAELFDREGGTAECWPWIIPGSGPWGAYFDREAYLPRLEALVRACTWERVEDNFPAQTSEPVQGPEGSANAIWLVGGDLVGTAIFSGTVATIGEIRFSNRFEVNLEDKKRKQLLCCSYAINTMDWFNNPE